MKSNTSAVMTKIEQTVQFVDALADVAQSDGKSHIALLARDASEGLLALLDSLAAAECGVFATDQTGAVSERRVAR